MKYNIHIIDDNPNDSYTIERLLKNNSHTFNITNCISSKESIEFLKNNSTDCILLDYQLPEMNGLEFIESQKKTNINLIPIILLTGQGSEEIAVRSLKSGAADYLTKENLSSEILEKSILYAIEKKKSELIEIEYKDSLKKLAKEIYDTNIIIEEKNKELLKIVSTKNKLISILAHDLRGPIGNIVSVLSLIEDEILDEKEKQKYLTSLKNGALNALELLEDLLIWASSQNEDTQLEIKAIPLKYMIIKTVDILIPIAKRKSIKINIEVDNGTKILADYNMVTTVIRNLTSNSIKFTNEGGLINITSHKLSKFIEIIVEDNGIGISKEELEIIFNINKVFSKKGTNGEKGSGFGLIMCKEFIEKNNGTLKIESIVGKGSKFIVTIPMAESH